MNSQYKKTYISMSICTGLNNGKFLLDLFLEKTLQHFYRIKSTRKWKPINFLVYQTVNQIYRNMKTSIFSSSVYTGLHYSKFQFYLFIKKVLRYFFRLTLTRDIETYISASTYVDLCNGKFRFDHPILEKALLHFNRIIIISI